jgi:MFS family permease
MDIIVMSYVAQDLTSDWHLGAAVLGVVFSAATFGMMVGALFVAPIADMVGRRPAIIGALTLMAVAMMASGFCRTVAELVIMRFAVGLGTGTMLASMSAVTSEFAPSKYRNFAVTLFGAAYPFGALITGLVTYWALPLFGWRHILMGGGLVTLVLIPVAILFMQESLEFLLKRQPRGALEKINRVRSKMGVPALAALPERLDSSRGPIPRPFKGRWRETLLLWLSFFSVYMTVYFVIAWIPKLAIRAGLLPSQGILAGASYNLGAFLGTAFLAWCSIRVELHKLIMGMMLAGAVILVVFAIPAPLAAVITVAFLIGFFIFSGFAAIYPVAAQVYPAPVRSTGIGWAIGIGRGGAVVGPLLGGYLISVNTPAIAMFSVFAVPLLMTGLFTWFIRPTVNKSTD